MNNLKISLDLKLADRLKKQGHNIDKLLKFLKDNNCEVVKVDKIMKAVFVKTDKSAEDLQKELRTAAKGVAFIVKKV